MDGNTVGPGVPVPPVNSGYMLGIGSIIESAFSSLISQLLRDGSLSYAKTIGNFLLGPALADKFVNLISIIFV